MAEPARPDEADPGPPRQGSRKSDALSPGWANVQRMHITAAEACAAAAGRLAAGDPFARRSAEMLAAMLTELGEITRRCAVDEAVVSAERARAYAQGVADCKARHCRFEVLPGGQVAPGPH